ncbi:MAG: 16S rRNA (guanine(527)-N(7))-methyltransferase RsmG [Alphaproteobacteria bacterium]|nr:16S rRNA (guanine(527)-N(7))-methyltransferase RsmG [Alphaproteobacteria bacterium]
MDIIAELKTYNVSRETIRKLENFVDLLTQWNQKMNLISKNSLSDVWTRHVLDSIQLSSYFSDKDNLIVDIGSGSGFPGIVSAIVLQEKNPQAKVVLVESITKKTLYLNSVSAELGLKNVTVINDRVENTVFKNADVITARAVASLDILLKYAAKIGGKQTKLLLLKGKSYLCEENQAKEHWNYSCEIFKNKYSEDGVIMKITNIRTKK